MTQGLTILIKPASGSCNLNCRYCFYHDVTDKREIKNYGMMSEDTLENLVKQGLNSVSRFITFAFQGGEPTLRGLDFYKTLHKYVEKYNKNNIQVNYALQTNGIIIDEEWAKFFHEHNYLIGLSLDGPKDINDLHRIDKKDKGSYNSIMQTAKLFDKYQVEYNILTVVNKKVAQHVTKIYNFFKKNNFKYLQFIPCLDELGKEAGNSPYSLTPKVYGEFLVNLFNLWYRDIIKGEGISIRMFDNILSILMGYPAESCDMQGRCSANAVIEADGSVYPCDFYVLDEWKLGNINNDILEDMLVNDVAKQFINVSINISDECRNCQYFGVCRGGCRRHKEPINNDNPSMNYFCLSYKAFYSQTLPRFQEIARNISNSMIM